MFHRRTVLGLLAGTFVPVSAFAQSKEPVLIGVTGPLTGQYAQYGAQWKRGFDVALDEINASGGINGRPLQYVSRTARATRASRLRSRASSCPTRASSPS